MKTTSLLFIAFFVSLNLSLSAQDSIPKPTGAVPAPPQSLNNYQSTKNKSYAMKVFFKDGSVIEKKLVLFINSDKSYQQFVQIDGKKVMPIETDSISIDSCVGIPANNTWLWRNISGRINIYAREPVKKSGFLYIEKQDSSPVRTAYSINSLKDAVKDDPAAFQFLCNCQKRNRLALDMIVCGGAIVAVGFFSLQLDILVAGGAVMVGSLVPFSISVNMPIKTIMFYNSQKK